jgi:multimeric flavodoxin WrbA
MPENLRTVVINTEKAGYTLTLDREDRTPVYPGMSRYVLRVRSGDRDLAVSCTNTYEYSPTNPLEAEAAAFRIAGEWEEALRSDPDGFLASVRPPAEPGEPGPGSDVVLIQGSPRADGNCSILSGWIAAAVRESGRTVEVVFPHDMDIGHCIGCYQCYNTGRCTIGDDMARIISLVRGCTLLVICSPVYTNSVPGSLKILLDRFQAYHAERLVSGGRTGQKGIIVSVSGRKGLDNFTCITRVLRPFMQNIGIEPAGELLIDGMDRLHDIGALPGVRERAEALVSECLSGPA